MKKALLLFIFVVCIAGHSHAQKKGSGTVDSLFAVLKTAKADTCKVNTLNAIASEFFRNNPDTAIYFANEAMGLATRLNYKMGIADALLYTARAFCTLSEFEKAMKKIDSSLLFYDRLLITGKTTGKSKILKQKARANSNLAYIYGSQGDFTKELKYDSVSLKLYEEIGDKQGIAGAYNNFGNAYFDLGNYPEGLKNHLAALKIYTETGNRPGLANSYNNIGNAFFVLGNYSEALKNHLAGLKIEEEIGNKQGVAQSYNNIGNIYSDQGEYIIAMKYYLAGLKIEEEIGNKRGISTALSLIGVNFYNQGNIPEAMKYYSASLKISEEIGDKHSLAISYINIGNIYTDLGEYTKALSNFSAALKICDEAGDSYGCSESYNSLGNVYTKLKNNSEASRYLNKGLLLSKNVGSLAQIQSSYKLLAVLDSAQGHFKQAFEHYKMYVAYRDSLINKENTKKIVQAQMQYEFDKKEAAAKAEQDIKDALALKELQKQKLLNREFAGGFAVLLIFAVILSILRSQYQKIRLIEKERNRISRELHDDIGSELNRITMISQLLHKKMDRDDEMQEKLMTISDTGKKVLGSIGEIIWTMNPQKDNLESLVAYIRRFATEYLDLNNIEVAIEFPDEIPAKSVSDKYRRNVFLVVKEALYNITKYSKASRVQLSMKLGKRSADLEISDNGTGFSVKEKQNWGNGLRNMDQRMKDIRGTFRISSEINQGTQIRLTFPVR